MPDGLAYQDQADFSAGAFPGMEVIPPNGVEDLVNGVPADDGSVFRRGPSVYKGSVAGSVSQPWRLLWDGYLAAGPRTLAMRLEGGAERGFTLDAADSTWIDLGFMSMFGGRYRPVVVGGMLVVGSPATGASSVGVAGAFWAGARGLKAPVLGVSMTVTNGSRTVTGTGFTASAEPGSILVRQTTVLQRLGVVESVQSATQLTLTRPWRGPTETAALNIGPAWGIAESVDPATTMFPGGSARVFVASMYDRLVLARGSRIAFTGAGDLMVFENPDDYHELPDGAHVIGMEPLQDQLLVFTTHGLFSLSGLAYDLTDAAGNVQQRLERADADLVLWDNRGVAAWEGAVVVPGISDVYLVVTAGAARPITGGMQRLYRSYVKAGYQTGLATVHDGRYVLPILNGDAWVDTLVCDLRSRAWTRWDGHGGQAGAFARRVGDDVRAPRLFAAGAGSDYRVLDDSAAFDPASSGSEADGSSHALKVTFRTVTGPGLISHMWRRFRARLELSGSPTVTLERAEGRPGQSFTTISSPQVRSDDGESIYSWSFNEQTRAIRFRLTVQASSVVLRATTAGLRVSGKYRP